MEKIPEHNIHLTSLLAAFRAAKAGHPPFSSLRLRARPRALAHKRLLERTLALSQQLRTSANNPEATSLLGEIEGYLEEWVARLAWAEEQDEQDNQAGSNRREGGK